jgi:hypothetical protein
VEPDTVASFEVVTLEHGEGLPDHLVDGPVGAVVPEAFRSREGAPGERGTTVNESLVAVRAFW